MTSLLARRRRAEEFARLLDERRRSHDSELAPLTDLAEMLRPAPIEPSTEFRGSLRERLMVAAAEQSERPVTAAPPVKVSRARPGVRIAAVAASLAVAGGMAGTAAASRDALPGDALYGVKRGLERTEAAIASGKESTGKKHLSQASTRLGEVTSLVGDEEVDANDVQQVRLVRTTLREFLAESRLGGADLLGAYRDGGRTSGLLELRGFTIESLSDLDQLDQLLPTEVDDTLSESRDLLTDLDGKAAQLCPSCQPNLDPGSQHGDLEPGEVPMAAGTQSSGRAPLPQPSTTEPAGQGGPTTPSVPAPRETPSDETTDSTPRPPSETAPPGPTRSPKLPLPPLPSLPEPKKPKPPKQHKDWIEVRVGDMVIRIPI